MEKSFIRKVWRETIKLKLINRGLSGTVQVIGDKSISHRAILFSALAEGTSVIKNLLISEDTKASLEIVEQMGADVKIQDKVSITGQGINGLKKPKNELNAKNSGTTARLLASILIDAKKRKTARKKLNNLEVDKGAPLKGKILIQMFEKASLRTRISFYLAIKQLGGGLVLFDYGFLNHKNNSSLQSLKDHKKNNMFTNVGNADITSLVNFSLPFSLSNLTPRSMSL